MQAQTTSLPGTTETLPARLAAGDPTAIEGCYRSLRPLVMSYLRRHLSGPDAEEVMQTTFTELWRSAHRYDPTRSLEAWTIGIAKKRAIDHLRRRRFDTVSVDVLEGMAVDRSDDVEERHLRAMEVRNALSVVSDDQRTVIELAYFEGMTQTEIAEHLDIPLGTVKARTFRGLKRLRSALEAQGTFSYDAA